MTRHDWVGKVIHWKICKNIEIWPYKKWYLHNPAYVLENDSHKLLRDFDIKKDHLILARRLDNNQQEKGNLQNCGFAVLADHGIKQKQSEKNDKYLDLARVMKNLGTWRWQLYQMRLLLLLQDQK